MSEPLPRARCGNGLSWAGRKDGLTERESEIFASITERKRNCWQQLPRIWGRRVSA